VAKQARVAGSAGILACIERVSANNRERASTLAGNSLALPAVIISEKDEEKVYA